MTDHTESYKDALEFLRQFMPNLVGFRGPPTLCTFKGESFVDMGQADTTVLVFDNGKELEISLSEWGTLTDVSRSTK